MTPDFGCYFFSKHVTVIEIFLCIKKSYGGSKKSPKNTPKNIEKFGKLCYNIDRIRILEKL